MKYNLAIIGGYIAVMLAVAVFLESIT